MDYKQIYQILRSEYGSIIKVAELAGVSRNSVTNVLTEKTANSEEAQKVRDAALDYVENFLSEKRKRIQSLIQEHQRLNEAAALLAATN
jgi:DNA-binding LacI/PurR family transcriptional regulator